MASLMLTKAQILRVEGKTRRAVVEGRTVRFQHLSRQCIASVSWGTWWAVHYASKAEAVAAKEIWESRGKVMQRGFHAG